MSHIPITIITISCVLIIALFAVGYITQLRIDFSRQKASPYECGLDPNASARIPFSLRFFLLAVIFLVLDVEIALLIAVPVSIFKSFTYTALITILFLLILIAGLIHEWREGSLEWN